jgi:hypothetical protein
MKRLLYIFLSLAMLFSFCGDAFAVNKKTKKDTTKAKVVTPKKPVVKKPAVKVKGKDKKYDNFIDKNKNGIDDRKEKLVPKSDKKDKKKPAPKKKKK